MQPVQDWYLSTLGIVRYIPRELSDPASTVGANQFDAATSLHQDQGLSDVPPVADNSEHCPAGKDNKSVVLDTLLASLDARLPKGAEEPEEQTAVQAEPQPVVELETAAEAPGIENTAAPVSFTLNCWHPVDDLLIINASSDSHSGETSSLNPTQEKELLSNILRAIGRFPDNGLSDCEEQLSSTDIVGEANSDNASTLVSMFISSRIRARGVCWVFLMGEAASAYVTAGSAETGGDSSPRQPGQTLQLAGGATGFVLPSLAALLAEPVLKKQVWQSISGLAENT